MLNKIPGYVFLFLCVLPVSGHAQPDDVARFDLLFFGYRLGMSYDEASSVRYFDMVGNIKEGPGYLPSYEAVVHSVYIDGLDTRIKAAFMDDRLFKVLVRFSPAVFEEMVSRFRAAYGPAENASKLVEARGGGEVRHRVYKWNFPNSSIIVIGSSNNTEFATASFFVRNEISNAELFKRRNQVRSESRVQE